MINCKKCFWKKKIPPVKSRHCEDMFPSSRDLLLAWNVRWENVWLSFTAIDMTKTKIWWLTAATVKLCYAFSQVIMYACMQRHLDSIRQAKSIELVLFDHSLASFTICGPIFSVQIIYSISPNAFVKLLKYTYDKPGRFWGHYSQFQNFPNL